MPKFEPSCVVYYENHFVDDIRCRFNINWFDNGLYLSAVSAEYAFRKNIGLLSTLYVSSGSDSMGVRLNMLYQF